MKAVRYRVGAEGAPRIGRLESDTVVDAGGSDVRGFIPSVENWGALESAAGEAFPLSDVTLLHPTVPEKILGVGLNYRDHAEESGLEIPERAGAVRQVHLGPDRPGSCDRDSP